MGQRAGLHALLCEVLASFGVWLWDPFSFVKDDLQTAIEREAKRHVYYQPPPNVQIAYPFISDANDIHVNTEEDLRERAALQMRAIRCLRRLLRLIDLAYRIFHLTGKRVKYWGSMVIDVRNRTQAWMRSDAYRYSD